MGKHRTGFASTAGLIVLLLVMVGCSSTSNTGSGTTGPGSSANSATATTMANQSATGTPNGSNSGTGATATANAGGAPTATAGSGGCNPAPVGHIVVASSSNIISNYVDIASNAIGGDQTEAVIATPNYTAGSHVYDASSVGVFYDTAHGQWAIFNEDHSAMQPGMAFNVVGAYTAQGVCFQAEPFTAANANTNADYMTLGGQPLGRIQSEQVFATQDWGYNGNTTYINSPLGVFWTGSQWAVFRQDRQALPVGVTFNVFFFPATSGYTYNHQADDAASNPDFTLLFNNSDNYLLRNLAADPSKIVLETPNWSYNSLELYSTIPTGVFYYNCGCGKAAAWAIFNENRSQMSTTAGFNVILLSAS